MTQTDDRKEVFCWLAFRLLALVPGFKPLEPQEQQRLRQETALLPEQPSWKELQRLGGLMAKAIGAKQPKWGESVTPQDLPAVGLTGKGEAFLVLAANADGSWLVETPQATRVFASLPAGCRLSVFFPINGDSEHARAHLGIKDDPARAGGQQGPDRAGRAGHGVHECLCVADVAVQHAGV